MSGVASQGGARRSNGGVNGLGSKRKLETHVLHVGRKVQASEPRTALFKPCMDVEEHGNHLQFVFKVYKEAPSRRTWYSWRGVLTLIDALQECPEMNTARK